MSSGTATGQGSSDDSTACALSEKYRSQEADECRIEPETVPIGQLETFLINNIDFVHSSRIAAMFKKLGTETSLLYINILRNNR
jgi:hypothetical protein